MSRKWYQKASVQTAIVSGVLAIAAAFILGYFGLYQGWYTLKLTEKDSSTTQNADKSEYSGNQYQSDSQIIATGKPNDTSTPNKNYPIQNPNAIISEKYFLTLRFNENDENARTIANNFKDYLEKYEEIEVQMEKIKTSKVNSNSYVITFLYRDSTQKNLIDKIWANLPSEYGDIKKVKDATLDSEFQILIKQTL